MLCMRFLSELEHVVLAIVAISPVHVAHAISVQMRSNCSQLESVINIPDHYPNYSHVHDIIAQCRMNINIYLLFRIQNEYESV